jgi:hypothetical protein
MRILGIAAGALASFLAAAEAKDDPYCRAFQDVMEPGRLYAADCTAPDCLKTLEGTTPSANVLERGARYEFMYLIGNTIIEKSAVIVSVRYEDVVKTSRLRVGLTRDAIAFACRLSPSIIPWSLFTEVAKERFPDDPAGIGRREDVDYENYDQYHRLGFSQRPDQDTLDQFHVLYSNGTSCVFTADGRRGRYFLLADRERVAGGLGRLLTRFGGDVASASASEESERVRMSSRIEVTLGNYAKDRQQRACFSFSVSTDHDAAEIELVDLEFHVQTDSPGSDGPPKWRVEFQD